MSGGSRRGLVVGAVVLIALGGVAAWAWFGLLSGGSPVQRAEIDGLTSRDGSGGDDDDGSDDDGEDLPDVVNVLMAGSDSRDHLSADESQELSLGEAPGARADTIMLVQMRPDGSDAAVLSIPRDLRVERCDGSTGKINAAFAIAAERGEEGGSCLVDTVARVTDIPVHHYVEIDVIGFTDVVDTLGGVEMCFDEAQRDRRSGLDVAEGCQRLDGADSLAYVRSRSLDDSGDFGRMERQQRFLKSLADEAAGSASLGNARQMLRTLDEVQESVKTDEGLGLGMMRSLASAFRNAGGDDIAATTVPGDSQTISGIWYVVMREDEAEEVFSAFRDGIAHEHLDRVASDDS